MNWTRSNKLNDESGNGPSATCGVRAQASAFGLKPDVQPAAA
jgi:hypothetical protein